MFVAIKGKTPVTTSKSGSGRYHKALPYPLWYPTCTDRTLTTLWSNIPGNNKKRTCCSSWDAGALEIIVGNSQGCDSQGKSQGKIFFSRSWKSHGKVSKNELFWKGQGKSVLVREFFISYFDFLVLIWKLSSINWVIKMKSLSNALTQ